MVIAGVIGAAAAIITQIIASVVTGKRENKRFKWEREKQDRDWKMQERERFLEQKQLLYSQYSYLADQFLFYIHVGIDSEENRPKPQELERLRANIDLIAPDAVSEATDEVVGKIVSAMVLIGNHQPVGMLEVECNTVRRIAVDLMREDLTGEKRRRAT